MGVIIKRKNCLSIFLLFSLILFCVGCGNEPANHTGEAQIPEKASELEGKNYDEVQKLFTEAGFTNIELEPLDDLITGWLKDEGEVKEVLVDGEDDFSKSSWVDTDTPVVIRYHNFKEKKDDTEGQSVKEETTKELPAEEQPEETSPTKEAPVEPLQESPVQQAPIEETPVESTTVESTPVVPVPVETTPVETAPIAEQPVSEQPVERYTNESNENTDVGEEVENSEIPAEGDTESIAQYYVLNTNTMKFHYPHCKSVSTIRDYNRSDVTANREELIAEGYSPCQNCNP